MPTKQRFHIDIPDGYRIYEYEFSIAGIQYRKNEFFAVMKKGDVTVGMRRDPDNRFDSNAIKVVVSRKGMFGRTIMKQIGFIPADIASKIADSKLFDDLILRPKAYYISDNDYIDFNVDILGPKSAFYKYTNV